MKTAKLVKRYRIDEAEDLRLAAFDAGDTGGLNLDNDECRKMLTQDVERLAKLQARLYAQDRWG